MTDEQKKRKPGTFKKNDPRINRNGRPRSFDAVRSIARKIADETALSNNKPIVINDETITVAEAILRKWSTSSNWQLQKAFIEVAFGKVPDVKHISGEGDDEIQIVLKWAKYDDDNNNEEGESDESSD